MPVTTNQTSATYSHSQGAVTAVATYNISEKTVSVKTTEGLDFVISNYAAAKHADFAAVQAEIQTTATTLFVPVPPSA
jgi:hypothetical protein